MIAQTEDLLGLQTLVAVHQNKKILSSRRCLRYLVTSKSLFKHNNTFQVEIVVSVKVALSLQRVLLLPPRLLEQSLSMPE